MIIINILKLINESTLDTIIDAARRNVKYIFNDNSKLNDFKDFFEKLKDVNKEATRLTAIGKTEEAREYATKFLDQYVTFVQDPGGPLNDTSFASSISLNIIAYLKDSITNKDEIPELLSECKRLMGIVYDNSEYKTRILKFIDIDFSRLYNDIARSTSKKYIGIDFFRSTDEELKAVLAYNKMLETPPTKVMSVIEFEKLAFETIPNLIKFDENKSLIKPPVSLNKLLTPEKVFELGNYINYHHDSPNFPKGFLRLLQVFNDNNGDYVSIVSVLDKIVNKPLDPLEETATIAQLIDYNSRMFSNTNLSDFDLDVRFHEYIEIVKNSSGGFFVDIFYRISGFRFSVSTISDIDMVKMVRYLEKSNLNNQQLQPFYILMHRFSDRNLSKIEFLNTLFKDKLNINTDATSKFLLETSADDLDKLIRSKTLNLPMFGQSSQDVIENLPSIVNPSQDVIDSNQDVIDSNQDAIENVVDPINDNAKDIIKTVTRGLDSVRYKIDDIIDQGGGNLVIGLVTTLLLMSPIIYLFIIKPLLRNAQRRYGISVVSLDNLFSLYYNVWESDLIKNRLYRNNYTNYKRSLFNQYLELYTVIRTLPSNKKAVFLKDIKNGVIRKEFMEPKNRKDTLILRTTQVPIDEVIYSIFTSIKLNQLQFNKVMHL